ncbi:Uncharacterised protein [Mycobacteroides abscessus subsp. abscessus]|nr:Uncharacterised protein [Mycobacteroides abscessus subsp. abscessus]
MPVTTDGVVPGVSDRGSSGVQPASAAAMAPAAPSASTLRRVFEPSVELPVMKAPRDPLGRRVNKVG